MNTILQRWSKWFIDFFHINMMLSIVSLPFLCAWGLPISLLSIVGNLVFGPFLALFLLISSCLFFTHLLGFSAGYVGTLLNGLCYLWLKLLAWGSPNFLVALSDTMMSLTVLCAVIAIVTLHHKQWGKPLQHISILCGLVLVIVLGSVWYQNSFLTHALYNKKKRILITKTESLLTVEDQGGLTERRSPTSFVQFSLIPTLCKKTGSLTIDKLVLHKLSTKTILALTQLCKTVHIKEIVYAPEKHSNADLTELLEQLKFLGIVTIKPAFHTKTKKASQTL